MVGLRIGCRHSEEASLRVLRKLICKRGVKVGQGKRRGRSVLGRRNSIYKGPKERKKLVCSRNWTERKSGDDQRRDQTVGPWQAFGLDPESCWEAIGAFDKSNLHLGTSLVVQ